MRSAAVRFQMAPGAPVAVILRRSRGAGGVGFDGFSLGVGRWLDARRWIDDEGDGEALASSTAMWRARGGCGAVHGGEEF